MFCERCGAQNPDNANVCSSCGASFQPAATVGSTYQRPSKFCASCGNTIDAQAVICPRCGVTQPGMNPQGGASVKSSKSCGAALALCIFLGFLGVHRFYAGKVGTGVLWLFTGGLFGIGAFIDFIIIICGAFKDGDGKTISWG